MSTPTVDLVKLPADTPEVCDGHVETTIRAIVAVFLPRGGMLTLCGACSRKL